jgi:perosamine synthetase
MCLTQDRRIARKLAILRDHGMNPERRYWHDAVGFNYRMTNMQAAIGVAQLGRLDDFLKKRQRVAEWYDNALKPLADKGRLQFQPKMDWSTQNHWMYSVLLPSGARARDSFIAALRKYNIDSRPFFYPVHYFPAYHSKRRFPVAEALSGRGVNLPMHVNLTHAQVQRIAAAVQEVLGA